MQALAIYESEVCDCGLHRSVADRDPEFDLTIRTCPVCAGLEQAGRELHARDQEELKELGESPAPETPRPTDGRKIGLSPNLTRELARLAGQTKDKPSTA